jgi:hypothetical protein
LRITFKLNTMSNTERFYLWLQKTGNIYLADNEQVTKAFHKIATK